MKNYPIFLLVFLLSNFSLLSQSMIEGSISDENGGADLVATITMHHLSDSSLTIEMSADEDGYFIMENIGDGEYWLEVSKTNYETIKIPHFQFPRDRDKIMGLMMIENGRINTIVRHDVSEKSFFDY